MRTLLATMTVGLILFVGSISAQVSPPETSPIYRLRTLPAWDYIHGLPVFSSLVDAGSDSFRASQVVQATEAEFLYRYGLDASYSTLSFAFRRLGDNFVYLLGMGGPYPAIDYNAWVARLTEVWLSENLVDLDMITELHFDDYTAIVERQNFNGDGSHEWILNMRKGWSDEDVEYNNYLVVEGRAGNYKVLPIPIAWIRTSANWHEDPHGVPYENLGIRDINADGLPEWLFKRTLWSVGPGYASSSTYTEVLGWRDGEIVTLASVEDATFENVDMDEAEEIITTTTRFDNWGCGEQTTRFYDWNGIEFAQQSPTVEPLDCTARQAEEAMWSGDFRAAATLYDTYIEAYEDNWQEYTICITQSDSECGFDLQLQIFLYFQGRRILAYALMGDTQHVQILIDELVQSNRVDAFTQAIIEVNDTEAEAICEAAYNYFVGYRLQELYANYLNWFLPGEIVENVNDGQRLYTGRTINPAHAGCDTALFSDTPTPTPTVTPTPYPTFAPPTPDTRSIEQRWIGDQNIYAAFIAADYETALLIVRQAAPLDTFDEGRWSYWRALVYEALDRQDDALNEYVNLYLNYPGSWWAWLAGLHLERIET